MTATNATATNATTTNSTTSSTTSTSSSDALLRQYFHQVPQTAPCYAALVLFFLAGRMCLVLTLRTRSSWYMLAVPLAAAMEVAGFGLRLGVIMNPTRRGLYDAMEALLIIAPALLPLANYTALVLLLKLGDTAENTTTLPPKPPLPLRPSWATAFFAAGAVLCLALQATGGGLVSDTGTRNAHGSKAHDVGVKVLLVGLFLQLGFFTAFLLLTAWAQQQRSEVVLEQQQEQQQQAQYGSSRVQLLPVYVCMYGTTALLYGRTIFRIVEFLQSSAGYIASHEALFYGFDFAPVCASAYLYCFLHPGLFLPRAPEAEASRSPKGSTTPVEAFSPNPLQDEETGRHAAGVGSWPPQKAAPGAAPGQAGIGGGPQAAAAAAVVPAQPHRLGAPNPDDENSKGGKAAAITNGAGGNGEGRFGFLEGLGPVKPTGFWLGGRWAWEPPGAWQKGPPAGRV